MAAVVPTAFKIIRVGDLGQEEVVLATNSANRQGKLHYVNTSGKAVLAIATTRATAGGSATVGFMIGVCSTKPRTSLADESMTLIREADVFLGAGVLDSMNIGAPLFLSNAVAGGFDDAAPATTNNPIICVGHVIPIWRESGLDKALRISTTWANTPGAVAISS